MLLVVSRSKALALEVADSYHYIGVPAWGVTPDEAYSEICEAHRAVLVLSPDTLADVQSFVSKLRIFPEIAIFAAYADKDYQPYSEVFDDVVDYDADVCTTIYQMMVFMDNREQIFIGDYRLAGISTCITGPEVKLGSHYIRLTRTERRILATLIRKYSEPCDVATILRYVYNHSNQPSPSAVKTHIANINKKFFPVMKRKIIDFIDYGYLIVTWEVLHPELFSIQRWD